MNENDILSINRRIGDLQIKVDSMAESIYNLGMAYLREEFKKPYILNHRDRVAHDAMINNLHEALWYLKYGLEKEAAYAKKSQ